MKDKQIERLRTLLVYVQKNIVFYSNCLKDIDIDILSNDELRMIFEKMPVISKLDMKKDIGSFIDTAINIEKSGAVLTLDKDYQKEHEYYIAGKKIITELTTGTSGVPFQILKTEQERFRLGVSLWKIRNQFSQISPDKMFRLIHNFDGYPFPFKKINDKNIRIKKELDYLFNSGYEWWHTNTLKLEEYANVLRECPMKSSNLRVIENNGSFISEEEIRYFEDLFCCKIANNYGCREVWNIAYSSRNGHLHINDDSIYFELIDDDGNIIDKPNVEGDVVVTSLFQYTMPFIRYKVGDRAVYRSNTRGEEIILIPNRTQIYGTDIYGNTFFRRVILELPMWYKIYAFDSIAVIQTGERRFVIKVQNLCDSKEYFEASFKKISEYIFRRDDYVYEFLYVQNLEEKSLFTVKM